MNYTFIYYVKMLGALLITNSHFDNLYPVSFLSIGGSLGNALFFLAAGFCLSNKIKSSFVEWILSRCKRLYPTMWIMSILIALVEKVELSLAVVAQIFIFPFYFLRYYWFIPTILILYILFFVIIRLETRKQCLFPMLALIVYAFYYIFKLDTSVWVVEYNIVLKFCVSFIEMYIGYYLKINWDRYRNKKANWYVLGTVCLTLMYLFSRLLTIMIPAVMKIQFMVQVLTIASMVFLFISLGLCDNTLRKWDRFNKFAKIISEATLEIYLYNAMCIRSVENIVFPLNIIVVLFMIFTLGVVTNLALKFVIDLRKKQYEGIKNDYFR